MTTTSAAGSLIRGTNTLRCRPKAISQNERPAPLTSTPSVNGKANQLKSSLVAPTRSTNRSVLTSSTVTRSSAESQHVRGPNILSLLEKDYIQVKQTDKLLHEQLSQWFQHMEQWMHYQKHVFTQIQDQCQNLGIDEKLLDRNESNRSLNGSISHLVLPQRTSSQQMNVQGRQAGLNSSASKLPAAAAISVGIEDRSGAADLLQWVPPPGTTQRSWPGQERLPESDLVGPGDLLANPDMGASGVDRLRSWSPPQPAPVLKQVIGDSTDGVNAGWADITNRSLMTPKLEAVPMPRTPLLSPRTARNSKSSNMSESEREPEMSTLDSTLSRASRFATAQPSTRYSTEVTNQYDMVSSTMTGSTAPNTANGSRRYGSAEDASEMNPITPFDSDAFAEAPWEELPMELRMWCTLVDSVLDCAQKKKLYDLNPDWKHPDAFLQRVQRNHDNLDLRVLVPQHGRGTSSVKRQSIPSRDLQHMPQNMKNAVGHTARHAKETAKKLLDDETRKCGARNLVLDPQSPSRLGWMSIGMFLMVYDLIVLPMQAFSFEENTPMKIVQWFGQIFWTLDIVVTFFTGVYVNSELKTDFRTIARVYATSWLPFDVAVVLPLWIVEFLDGSGSGDAAENAGAFRMLRMMRFLRLARLAKFEHYLQEALASVNSSSLILLVGIAKLMTGMIIISHLNACIWYAVGDSQSGGWISEYRGHSRFYNYLTSMHWAFTQFQGTSEVGPWSGDGKHAGERAYAVVVVMFSLIILSCFVSSLTNMMMQLQQLREEKMGMARSVRAYLSDNDISKGLSVRVKKYIDWKQRMQRKLGSSSEILGMLPIALQMDLQEEVRGPLIATHKFLAAIQGTHLRTFRSICYEVLAPLAPAPGEMVFSTHDECNQMYFCVAGQSRYTPLKATNGSARLERSLRFQEESATAPQTIAHHEQDYISLWPGDYLCEPCLWTHWEYCGSLLGIVDASFLIMDAERFTRVIISHPPAHVSVIFYARRFVAGLNRFGKTYHDIINISMLAEEEMDGI